MDVMGTENAATIRDGVGEKMQILWLPRAKNARGKVRGALPRTPARGIPPETPAPFPFSSTFRNGPRRPGCASKNLLKRRKDFSPPRRNRAHWTATGRSEDMTMTRERGQMQRPPRCHWRPRAASLESATGGSKRPRIIKSTKEARRRSFAPPPGSSFD